MPTMHIYDIFLLLFQLWDLTCGKLLHDFKQHTAPSTCVEFHPKEFLLATASNDRFVFHFRTDKHNDQIISLLQTGSI